MILLLIIVLIICFILFSHQKTEQQRKAFVIQNAFIQCKLEEG